MASNGDGWGAAAAAPEANGQTNGAGDGWGAASDNPPAIQEPQADGQPATDGVDDADVPKASDLLESLSHEVQVTLADKQADPNSPLYSIHKFEDLNLSPELLKGVYKMGFQKPSRIQEKALPLLLANPPTNFIGQSQSGTGKTAAFVLNMLSRVDPEVKQPQAICVAPARELAMQIVDVVQKMGEYTQIEVFHAGKGTVQRGSPRLHQQIVVGTPGTIYDMATRLRLLDLSAIKVFVLDEADNMLEQGTLGEQSMNVKNLVVKASSDVQIVLFSATFAENVRTYASKFAPGANEIKLKPEELSLSAIKQFFMDCDSEEHKYEVLVELYNLLTIGQSIIFVRRRDTADEIAHRMTQEAHTVVSLHGLMDTAQRDEVMANFRDGKSKVLIATNVIARGIDVLQVNMVVNYDMPITVEGEPDVETYLHRIGRTGRFGRQGISINFVHDRRSFDTCNAIGEAIGQLCVRVDTSDYELMEKTLKAALKN